MWKYCRTCCKFYCMFYFTCDRSLTEYKRTERGRDRERDAADGIVQRIVSQLSDVTTTAAAAALVTCRRLTSQRSSLRTVNRRSTVSQVSFCQTAITGKHAARHDVSLTSACRRIDSLTSVRRGEFYRITTFILCLLVDASSGYPSRDFYSSRATFLT